MVLQYKINFTDWSNLTRTGTASTRIVLNSNPLNILFSGTAANETVGVQTDSFPGVFNPTTTETTVYFRFRSVTPSTNLTAGIYITDGTRWMRFVFNFNSTNRRVARGTNIVSEFSTTGLSFVNDDKYSSNTWIWFKLVINGTAVTVYSKEQTVKPEDADWEAQTDLDFTMGGLIGALTEIGISGNFPSVTSSWDWEFDDLEVVQGEGIPISNSVVDGDTIKLSSVYVKKTLGQIGSSARLTYHDPNYANAQTIETAHRTVTTISETRFNTRFFQGEITNTDTTTKEIVAKGIEAKLARTVAGYDPVFTRGVVEYFDDNTIYKQDSGPDVSPVFSSYGTLTDKLIVFIRTNLRRYICGLDDVSPVDSGGTPIVPDLTVGSITNLFFANRRGTDSESGLYYRNDGRFYVELTFTALIKDGSTIDKVVLNIWCSGLHGTQTNRPKAQLWDYTNNTWRDFNDNEFRERSKDNHASRGNEELYLDLDGRKMDITVKDDIETGVFADYSNVSAANSYGWKTHEYKVRLDSGTKLRGNEFEILHIWKSEAVFDLDTDQRYQVGVGKIQTVNDHNLVLYPNASVSWLDNDVRDDGISGGGVDEDGEPIGDTYYITDKISDILEALWTESGADSIVNLNVELTSEIPDIEDLRSVMILQYVQKIKELLGAIYFTSYTTDPENDLPTFNITDSPSDSGLTLTQADFIEPLKQTNYKIDSSMEMSQLKLVASEGLIGTAAITTEHTPELGLEVVKITRPDIHTSRQASSWLDKKKLLYTNAHRYFTARINYDKALQDYSLLDVGKEATVTNSSDGNTIVDHQSGTDGRLLVYQMELNRNWENGYKNVVTLLFQRRFA